MIELIERQEEELRNISKEAIKKIDVNFRIMQTSLVSRHSWIAEFGVDGGLRFIFVVCLFVCLLTCFVSHIASFFVCFLFVCFFVCMSLSFFVW